MAKDKRYTTIKKLILAGYINDFREIFDTLPKSVVYQDLGMNSARFNKLMHRVDTFMLKDIFRIAKLVDVDEDVMLKLIYKQYLEDKLNKKAGKEVM